MRDVYRNATFCIAATAAKDGDVGLFFGRNSWALTPFRVTSLKLDDSNSSSVHGYWATFNGSDPAGDINLAPLNSRAWVAQERHLSPRILHFTHSMLYWECMESFTSETHPECIPLSHSVYAGKSPRPLKTLVNDCQAGRVTSDRDGSDQPAVPIFRRMEPNVLYSAWLDFRSFYTRAHLTHESDIFVALRGVAEEVEDIFEDEMIAGLWRKRLIRELCWETISDSGPTRPHRPLTWRAPSWSWASTTQEICEVLFENLSEMSTVIDIRTTTDTLGTLTEAFLVLQCHLVPIPHGCVFVHGSVSSGTGDSTVIEIPIYLDEPTARDSESRERFLICVGRVKSPMLVLITFFIGWKV